MSDLYAFLVCQCQTYPVVFRHRRKGRAMMTLKNTKYTFKVCVYCTREVSLDSYSCSCGEYKGIMTVEAYEDYLGVKWED